MNPSFIPAAAATRPLPGPAAAPGAAPAKDGGQFADALAASLDTEAAAPARAAATPAAPARPYTDPLALAEWVLTGVTPEPAEELVASEALELESADEEADPDVEEGTGEAWWEMPIDALLATPAPMQDAMLRQPLPPEQTPIEIPITVEAAEPGPRDLPLSNRQAGTREENLKAAPVVNEFRVATSSSTRLTAAAPASGDAMPEPAEFETMTALDGQKDAAAATRQAPAPPAFATGTTPDAAPRASLSEAQAAALASEASAAAADTVGAPTTREARPAAADNAPRNVTAEALRAFANGDASTGNRTDTQTSEGEARQSAASMRLAAALSAAGSTPAEGASPAPVFSVPTAAAVAPVAGAAAPATTAPAAAAPDPENVTNIVEAMRVTARNGGWEATVRLRPEHLGEVTIALRVDGNNVSATVNAEAAGIRSWLMGQEDAVRSGMAEHGLQLQKFEIDRDGQRGHEQEQPQQRRRQARQQREAERFEIVV